MYGNNDDRNENQSNFSEDFAYTIFDSRGRPKNKAFSIASMVCGVLSISFSFFGWAALVLGICAIIFSIISRKNMGYFNGFAIAGLITGIIGTVFGFSLIIVSFVNPAFFEEFIMSVPDGYYDSIPDTTPSDPNTTV